MTDSGHQPAELRVSTYPQPVAPALWHLSLSRAQPCRPVGGAGHRIATLNRARMRVNLAGVYSRIVMTLTDPDPVAGLKNVELTAQNDQAVEVQAPPVAHSQAAEILARQ